MSESEDDQFNEMDFLRAQFFSSETDMATAKAAIQSKRDARDERRALRQIAQALNTLERISPRARYAAVKWLAEKYGHAPK